jgi:hypothetical protein
MESLRSPNLVVKDYKSSPHVKQRKNFDSIKPESEAEQEVAE